MKKTVTTENFNNCIIVGFKWIMSASLTNLSVVPVCLVLPAQRLCSVLTFELKCLICCKSPGFWLHVILEVDLYRLGQFGAWKSVIEDCAVNPGGSVRSELENGDCEPSLLVLHLGSELCNTSSTQCRD